MNLITISRQFGSGGRELGRRLSELLGWDYYDKQIITRLAEQKQLDPSYVQSVLSNHIWQDCPLTYRDSFHALTLDQSVRMDLLRSQREILENIAESGNDCIIIGRNADIILQQYRPFRIFACADIDQRVERCMNFERKKGADCLTEKEVLRNIQRIDKERARNREILTGKDWDNPTSFDLVLNTGGQEIRAVAQSLESYVKRWFHV